MSEWKFLDPPNVAVVIDSRIAKNSYWIARVLHDAEDGAWQFHVDAIEYPGEIQPILISLRSATQLDPSIVELSSLPLGWQAWRTSVTSAWNLEPQRSV